MASAKFANRTVNQSHSVICKAKPKPGMRCARFQTRSMVVNTAPISTTNITGFFVRVRGLSLRTESHRARPTIPDVQRDFCPSLLIAASKDLSGVHQQVIENRTQAEGREESKRTHDQNHRNQQHGK